MKLTRVVSVRRFLNSPFHYNDFDASHKRVDGTLSKENVYAHTAWEWSTQRYANKIAHKRYNNLMLYETIKAEDEPKMKEFVARERVKAAVESLNMPIMEFTKRIRQARLGLNAQALAQLAIWEPASFRAIVHLAKGLALADAASLPGKEFTKRIQKAQLGLNTQALAQLAICEPASFRAIVHLAKGLALADAASIFA